MYHSPKIIALWVRTLTMAARLPAEFVVWLAGLATPEKSKTEP